MHISSVVNLAVSTKTRDIHEFVDELESNWKLLSVFQPSGETLAESIELEEEEIIGGVDFANVQPDDEECDGWTGHEGCTATHFYHRTCAVIMPREGRLDFLSEPENVRVEMYVCLLLKESQHEDLRIGSREELNKLCDMVIEAKNSPEKPRQESAQRSLYGVCWETPNVEIKGLSRVSNQELGALVRAAVVLERPDILQAAVKVASNMLPPQVFYDVGKTDLRMNAFSWLDG